MITKLRQQNHTDYVIFASLCDFGKTLYLLFGEGCVNQILGIRLAIDTSYVQVNLNDAEMAVVLFNYQLQLSFLKPKLSRCFFLHHSILERKTIPNLHQFQWILSDFYLLKSCDYKGLLEFRKEPQRTEGDFVNSAFTNLELLQYTSRHLN